MDKTKLLLLSIVFFWFAQYVYIPFQTPYLAAMGINTRFIGIIVGTYGVAQMLLRLPVGILADCRNRHKMLIIIGGLSSGLASVFRFLFNNGIGYLIGNVFSGIASAMWISFMVLYMSFYPQEEQQKATGRIVFANNLGMLMGFILSTFLYDRIGMRWICMMSILGGAVCAGLSFFLPKGEKIESEVKISAFLQVCTQKKLIVFAILAFVQQGVQMSTTMSFTMQIVKNLGAAGIMVGLTSIIYMLSAVLFAQFAATDLCAGAGVRKWIPTLFFTTAVYCILIPQCTSVIPVCILQILPGASTGILATYTISEAMADIPKEKKSTAMGFFQAVYALGMTVFPIICGHIAELSSIRWAYIVMAGTCISAAIGSITYYKGEKGAAHDK